MVKYIYGKIELLSQIKPLWEELNRQHIEKTNYFENYFESLVFEKRVDFLNHCSDVRIVLVKDDSFDTSIGYSISSIKEEIGSVDSVYVEESYRRRGIGKTLFQDSMAWMDHKNIIRRKLDVVKGNDESLLFYEHFGFKVKYYGLERVQK